MSIKTREINQRLGQKEQVTFRRTAIAIALAGITAFSAGSASAAEDQALAELQKALEVLKAENANLKKQLDNKQIKAADTATTGNTANNTTDPNAETKTATTEDSSILDAVVVKFKKKSILEKVKDVPKSVSIVSGEELEKQGALNVGDILKRIGNVKWNYGNPKTGSMSIRGISAGSTEAIDPSLGVNVDGVPYAYVALASGADYVDLDTVDVTRGPQGSTGGKNTSMGTINIKTKRPSFTPEANASITFGQQNTLITQAAVGGAVIDDLLAWRGTFYRNQQEGYYKNQYNDIEDRTSYVNTDRTYGRAQFLLTPSETFNALVSMDYKPKGIEFVNGLSYKNSEPATYANGAPVYIPNGTIVAGKSTASNLTQNKLNRSWFTAAGNYSYQDFLNQPINEDNNKGILNGSKGASAQLNWDVLGHTLTSITGYKDNFFQASNDEGTPFDITKNSGLYVHYKQESQELKIASKPGGFVDYTGGLFYLQNESDASSRTRYGSDAGAWFANDTQYSGAATAANGLNATSAGRLLLKDSLDRVFARTVTFTDNKSGALFGQADWHLSEPLTLTTGIRFTKEDRSTSQVKEVTDSGYGAALNPVANGGFGSTTTGALAGTNTSSQNSVADQLAAQYFGKTIAGAAGATYNTLSAAEKQQVANAKAIRASTAFNGLYNNTAAESFNDVLTTGNISLNYKFSEDHSTYASWQRGAKAGISQISGVDKLSQPVSRLVNAESSDVYELGIKSAFLDKTLTVNADIFLDNLKNFQQSVTILDPILTAQAGTNQYTSITGNVPLVRIKGLELDATYTGVPYTSLRFAGAYNDARYADSVLLALPVEQGNQSPAYRDVKGQSLPNAAKFTFNLSAEYRRPVLGNKEFHSNVNYNYTSKYKSDAALSDYSVVDGYGVTDIGIGIGRKDKLFDANFLVKNLFDTEYRNNQTWNSYVPSNPRWIGIVLSSKL